METLFAFSRRIGLEVLSYLMLIVGTLGDHVSTVVALSRTYNYVTKTVTVQRMERGLWLPVDIVLIVLGIAIPYVLIHFTEKEYFKALLAYPLVHGLIRFGACLWNFSLVI